MAPKMVAFFESPGITSLIALPNQSPSAARLAYPLQKL
jgi:hypothetical protein